MVSIFSGSPPVPPVREGEVACKVCAGCGQRVDDSAEVGKLYWCNFAYRKAAVRIARAPLWKKLA